MLNNEITSELAVVLIHENTTELMLNAGLAIMLKHEIIAGLAVVLQTATTANGITCLFWNYLPLTSIS